MNVSASVQAYFVKLGLSEQTPLLYAALTEFGPQTISELSRSSGVERTRIYRLLDELKSANLIEINQEYKHGIVKAAPLDNLQIMLAQKEQEVSDLHDLLPLIEQQLSPGGSDASSTQVRFYRGATGIKQMLWNETKAKGEILSILSEGIQLKTKSKFFERWVSRCNDRELQFRSIVGERFTTGQEQWYAAHINDGLQNWKGRKIDSCVFPVTHSTLIYDDIVGYFYWDKDEIFGIEIQNQLIASAQVSLFEMLWQQGKSIDTRS